MEQGEVPVFDPSLPTSREESTADAVPVSEGTPVFDPSLPTEVEAKERKLKTPQVKQSPLSSALSYSHGLAQQAAQGMFAGFGDEIAGVTTATAAKIGGSDESFGDIYDETVRRERQGIAEFKDENPKASFVSEVAGSVPTALLGGLALKGAAKGTGVAANLAQKAITPATRLRGVMGKGALAGGAYGSTYGAGTSEGESYGDIAADAATGGLIGSAGGALIPGAIAGANVGGKKVIDFVQKLRGTDKNATQKVMRNLADRAGLPIDEVEKIFNELGDEAIIADVHPTFLAQLKQSLDEVPELRGEVSDILFTRQKGQGAAIKRDLLDEMGDIGGDNLRVALDKLGKARAKEASPLYESALKQNIPDSEDYQRLKALPVFQDAYKKAGEYAKNDLSRVKKTVDSSGMGLNQKMCAGRLTEAEKLHYAKQALWDAESTHMRSGAQKAAGDVGNARKELTKILDEIPEYKQARGIWADSMDREAAAEIGKDVFKNSVDAEDFAYSIQNMSPSELQMVKIQAIKDANRKIGFKGETDNMTKMMTKPEQKEKMAALFGSEDAADEFAKKISKWDIFAKTKAEALHGSDTKRWQKGSDAGEDAAKAVLAPKLAALDYVKKKLTGKLTKEAHKEIVNKLTTHGLSAEDVTNILAEGTTQEIEHNIANRLSVPVAAAVIPNKLSNGAKKVDRRGRKR